MAACVSDCKRSERGAGIWISSGRPSRFWRLGHPPSERLRSPGHSANQSRAGPPLEFSMSLTTIPNSTLIGLSMQATFGFIPAFPSARSFVLALPYLVSAMRATDARIAAVVKRVIG